MVNTGRVTAVERCGHQIAKVVSLNVRDEGPFRAVFVHPAPVEPPPAPIDELPSVPCAKNLAAPARGVEIADANVGQFSDEKNNWSRSVPKPFNNVGILAGDSKGVRACTVRGRRV